MFKNIRLDLQTYEGDWSRAGFWVMLVYRFGRWRYTIRYGLIRKPFSLLYKILFRLVQILTGIELPCEATVGPKLRIDHFGGIIISGYTIIGRNCVLRPGVVIGLRRVSEPQSPHIGDNVDIGAGAKILGPIRIGNNVNIGANAVVLQDVPDNSTVVGVPARIISRNPK